MINDATIVLSRLPPLQNSTGQHRSVESVLCRRHCQPLYFTWHFTSPWMFDHCLFVKEERMTCAYLCS